MSQLVSILADSPAILWAVLLVAVTWSSLVLATAVTAAFHRSRAQRDAALRVLDRLLRCLPAARPVRGRTR